MSAMELPRQPVPPFAHIRQYLPTKRLADPRAEVHARLRPVLRDQVRPGHRIAITAGSRGIGGFVPLLQGICDAVREAGGEPFLVPAMGSHGGATDEGQAEVLRLLGVGDVEAEVRSSMETVELGTADNGAVVHLDRHAAEADGILVLGRVKTHPESAGELASGLLKMATIGLGKQAGAFEAHSHRLWDSVVAVPRVLLARAKILAGIAVVENGYREPLVVEVVPPAHEAWLEADQRLLRVAKAHLALLPFERLDVLVVDEIGKTISGAGMDPNVIGRWHLAPAPHRPDIRRIVALSITPPSLGNGIGAGLADFVSQRLADAYDPQATYINLLTASEPDNNTREGPLPLALPSDREAIAVGLFSALAPPEPRVARIRNTGALDELWVSGALVPEVVEHPRLEVLEPPAPLPFDAHGNLG